MIRKKKNSHRGQLQIAETLVSVALMLVLGLLLINAANQTISPYSNLENLDRVASDILTTTDEAGLLRPVVYLYGNILFEIDYLSYRSSIDNFISSIVSGNIGYAMIAHRLINGSADQNYFTLIGTPAEIIALQNTGEGSVTNYFLGSFSSATYGLFYSQYLVRLYLWEKI
jgi:hypothetical protein